MTKSKNGRGNPTGKKVINPQYTLEAKKALVRKAGGRMTWGGKVWTIKSKTGRTTELSSRKLASYTLPTFAKSVSSLAAR